MGREKHETVPRIGITIGDPAGIGPEIVIKALADTHLRSSLDPIVIGSLSLVRSTSRLLGSDLDFVLYDPSATPRLDSVAVEDPGGLTDAAKAGFESEETGRSAAVCIETAVRMWKNGQIDALATAPISKNALALAGYKFAGHTEFLADLTGTSEFAMSFFADRLRVVLLSTHLSLLDAINKVTTENLIRLIRFTNVRLGDMLQRDVRIAVAGVNPHASEGGMFGDHESREIAPAIARCRDQYEIDVSGPYSPDTVFLRAYRGEFDAVIACYHDQATIAVKCLSFGSAVNVTLGLPLIRTSVDHGTAFDIAGKGIADESSMKAALRTAVELLNLSKSNHCV